MVIKRDVFHDCQPDSAAALLSAAGGNAVEAFEDPVLMFGSDSAAAVADAEVNMCFIRPDCGDLDPFCAAVQDRIGDQIVQRLLEKKRVALEFGGIAFPGFKDDSRRFRSGRQTSRELRITAVA